MKLTNKSIWFFRAVIVVLLCGGSYAYYDITSRMDREAEMTAEDTFYAQYHMNAVLDTQIRILHHVDGHANGNAHMFCPECLGDGKLKGMTLEELKKHYIERHQQIHRNLMEEEKKKYEPESDSTH